MKTTPSPISFADPQFSESRHVCAFFHRADEEYRVLLPFIKDGFECGDKGVHVVSPGRRGYHLNPLTPRQILLLEKTI
jgi:hypothetical protein